VLYELLTGRPPYRAATSAETRQLAREGRVIAPRQLDPRIPRALESTCLRAMAYDPADRHASAEELERELRRFARRSSLLAPLAALGASVGALTDRVVASWAGPHPAEADELLPASARPCV
jgi:serine/threonine protein kinase